MKNKHRIKGRLISSDINPFSEISLKVHGKRTWTYPKKYKHTNNEEGN